MVGRAGLESRGDFAASNKILILSGNDAALAGCAPRNPPMTPFSASLAYVPVGVAVVVDDLPSLWNVSTILEIVWGVNPAVVFLWRAILWDRSLRDDVVIRRPGTRCACRNQL